MPTKIAVTTPLFTVDAARVSKVNNPGDLAGLVAITPGSKVWLMMYFTVKNVPGPLQRTTTYLITYGGKTVFKIAYKVAIKSSDVGRFSRYTVYSVPRSLPYGKYEYSATLKLGHTSATRRWGFKVAKQERPAKRTRN